jgi:hypothetical protein
MDPPSLRQIAQNLLRLLAGHPFAFVIGADAWGMWTVKVPIINPGFPFWENRRSKRSTLMRHMKHIRIFALTLTVFAFWSLLPAQAQTRRHVGPARLYPTPRFTPGKAATLSVDDLNRPYKCKSGPCTYSKFHRPGLKASTKRDVYETYGYEPDDHPSGEVDHVYPLCAGGSNDKANLWFQPEENPWKGRNFGFKEKDALEAWVCRQIKAGELEPQQAYSRLVGDWVSYYLEIDPQGLGDDDDDEKVQDDPASVSSLKNHVPTSTSLSYRPPHPWRVLLSDFRYNLPLK